MILAATKSCDYRSTSTFYFSPHLVDGMKSDITGIDTHFILDDV